MMSARGGMLVLMVSSVCTVSCFEGTPMLGHERCHYMPSVEECQTAAASLITEKCLRDCVIDQCSKGQTLCGAEVVAQCSERSVGNLKGRKGGYVFDKAQTCEMPKRWVDWCQIEQSPRCQELSMVHERAHACGWHHREGKGVPGDEGRIVGCSSPDL